MPIDIEALGIGRLSVGERLELIEEIWDSLPVKVLPDEVPAWHLPELAGAAPATRRRGWVKPWREVLGRHNEQPNPTAPVSPCPRRPRLPSTCLPTARGLPREVPPALRVRCFLPAAVILCLAPPAAADPSPSAPITGRSAPSRRRPVPAVHDGDWVRTPIDAFVLARLEAEGVKPAPSADKRTLLRRVYSRPDRPAADAGGAAGLSRRRLAASLREGRRRPAGPAASTASAGRGTGSTWCATPRPTATSATAPSRAPGATATTSSTPSTRTSPTTVS